MAVLLALLAAVPQVMSAPPAQGTPTGVLAEAIGEANVRSGPGIDYDLLGTIYVGTRYEVYGQHEFFPWVLIAYPDVSGGRGWVFADLVTLTTPLEQLPFVTATITAGTAAPASSTTSPAVTATLAAATPTPTPDIIDGGPTGATSPDGVYVEAMDETNVRFGPGVDYPRIGRIYPGERYEALSRHSLYPWLLIRYPGAPSGAGWVFQDVIEVIGDIYSLPVIAVTQVGWPTLTPTPPFVVTSLPPWQGTITPQPISTASSIDLQSLGDNILAHLLEQGFVPEEDRYGSVFLLDLASGQNFSLGDGIAYSGMSLIKIPILVEFYRQLDRTAAGEEIMAVAETMICSDNMASNELLSLLGGGDPFAGAINVTRTMRELGLDSTFILTPFEIPGVPPLEPNAPLQPPSSAANQNLTQPDTYNQSTPEDLGWLLNAVYQCAMDESGPLLEIFPDEFTPTECRQMILTLSANEIGVLTEAGVPEGIRVAHKHGWVDDTHGDAAIIFTPGGDFVLTMALHQPTWLPYESSWPAMAEITRLIYNAYNPDEPLGAIHPEIVEETCDVEGNPLLAQLSASELPPIE